MAFTGPRHGAVLMVTVTIGVVLATMALVLAVSRDQASPVAAPPEPDRAAASIAPRAVDGLDVRGAVASLTVLRNWDAARASAWARGSPPALQRLYLPGSRSGARDVAMLRSWRSRGLRVHGMRMQVMGVELRTRAERRIVLVVTDRLVGAVAVGRGGRRVLPQDRISTRRLTFVRRHGQWRVSEVYDGGAESASSPASPEASTEVTSGSANR